MSKLSKLSYYRIWSFHPIFRSIDFVRSKKVSSINWYQRWKAATGQGVAATRQAGKKSSIFFLEEWMSKVNMEADDEEGVDAISLFFACIENHSINASLWDWLSEGRGISPLPPSLQSQKKAGRYRGSEFYLFCIYDFRKLITDSFARHPTLTSIKIFDLGQSVQVNWTNAMDSNKHA